MQSHEQRRLRQNPWSVVFLIASVAIILLLASGLSTLQLRPGGSLNVFAALLDKSGPLSVEAPSTSALTPLVDGGPILNTLRTLFWALLPLALIYAFVSPQFRRQLLRAAIFVIAVLFAFNRLRDRLTPVVEDEQPMGVLEPLPPAGVPQALPDPPALVTSTPEWIVWSINIALASLIVLLVWFLWRKFRPQPQEADAQAQVAQQAEAALSELEDGGDLKDVILRCYAQMSAVLHENSNVQRHRAMTARDFEAHLARLGFHDDHISRLTRLFEAARYSPDKPDPAAEEEAIACLTAIVHDYDQDKGEGPGQATGQRP